MEKEIPFTGILSNKAEENPGFFSVEKIEMIKFFSFLFLVICISRFVHVIVRIFVDFFNWNRVKLRYCDGASFAGDSEDEVQFDIPVFLKLIFWLQENDITKLLPSELFTLMGAI